MAACSAPLKTELSAGPASMDSDGIEQLFPGPRPRSRARGPGRAASASRTMGARNTPAGRCGCNRATSPGCAGCPGVRCPAPAGRAWPARSRSRCPCRPRRSRWRCSVWCSRSYGARPLSPHADPRRIEERGGCHRGGHRASARDDHQPRAVPGMRHPQEAQRQGLVQRVAPRTGGDDPHRRARRFGVELRAGSLPVKTRSRNAATSPTL